MVCDRCKMVVRSELEKIGIFPVSVGLGEVELLENLKENQKQELEMKFQSFGFELLEDKKDDINTLINYFVISDYLAFEKLDESIINKKFLATPTIFKNCKENLIALIEYIKFRDDAINVTEIVHKLTKVIFKKINFD